jgi:hypothetical protein
MMTRETVIAGVIKIVRLPLPPGATEAQRREALAKACFMTSLQLGDTAWPQIWSEVMKATGCKSWRETMDKAKH